MLRDQQRMSLLIYLVNSKKKIYLVFISKLLSNQHKLNKKYQPYSKLILKILHFVELNAANDVLALLSVL